MTDETPEPAIRMCTRVEDLPVPCIETSVIDKCGSCGAAVWRDAAQELPAEARDAEIMCEQCLCTRPGVREILEVSLPLAYLDYLMTGVIKPIHID